LVGELNLISVAFAVLFIGLGVDFGIHFTLRYLETGVADRAGPQALVSAGAAVGGALTLSAVCAAAGFFAFLPTDYVGLAELGLIAGIGMFVALTANLTVLPACLAVAPPRAVLNSAVTDRRAQSVAAALQRHAKSVLAAAGLAAVASFALVPSIEFDFNPLNLRDPGTESVATFLDLARDPNSSFYAIDLLVDNVDAIGAVSRDLADLDQVSDVVSVLSFVPDNQDEKLEIIDELAFFLAGLAAPRVAQPTNAPAVAPPAADEVGAQLAEFQRLLAERAIAQDGLGQAAGRLATALDALGGPDAQLTQRQIVDFEHRLLIYLPHLLDRLDAALYAGPVALETLPAQITEQWVAADGRARLLVQPASGITTNAELARFADTVATVAPRATGTPVIVTEAGRVILNAFMTATAIACIAILIILFATVRRPADIGLILVPLIFAAALTIAASVALGLAFNFANIIVLPLLLGLGIASAIHFVLRWRAGGGDMTVVASSTPRAVFFSAMTTVAAFGSLALSSHLGMRSMGLLLAIALTATLISTLIVLPSLMVLVGGNADRKKVVGGSAKR
ncbi:MAG: MMPL family transporter, partial [Alphaproteobacteria bacterium]|nr:MMPL family transporter [Alphaproteobacteria bacterium]